MWFQLLIEVLLRLPQTPEAKSEMIAECRFKYKENAVQLEKITIFEKTYTSSDAIQWHTESTFVFQLFNIAFREQDFEVIFKYRYFLVDLFNQLHCLYKEQYKNRGVSLTIFRGQLMCREELLKLKQNVGNLISINTFFSTSTSCAVAADFAGNGEHESIGIISVIFRITIDPKLPCRPFANISQLSRIKDESEILFSIGTIFRIESVDLETDTIWQVKLTWIDDCQQQLNKMKHLTDLLNFYTGHNIGDRPSILTFGLFLSKMGLLHQARRFYWYLRKILPSDHPDRGVLYNNLGEVLRRLNYFNHARNYFIEALKYCTDTMSIFHPFWAIIHSNIALVDLNCKRPKQALKFYRCALLIITRPNYLSEETATYMEEILAIVYHGMGSVYCDLGQYQAALTFCHKALEIELRILPRDHPSLVDTYNELSRVNIELNKWREAFENCEESLRIAQQALLPNDLKLVSLHVNAAVLVYHVDRDVSKTLVHCTKALQLMERTTLTSIEYNRLDIYKTLADLYTRIGLMQLAFPLWEKFICAVKAQFIAESNFINFPDLERQLIGLRSLKQISDQNSKSLILVVDKSMPIMNSSMLETIARCNIADSWRARGHTKPAISYYTCLLDDMPESEDAHFNKVHKSRLHNNLAACYQDLDDDQMALYHYRLSLDYLSSEEEKKSIQAGITHYNIALIYMNINELDEARIHLQKSLLHFSGVPENKDRTFYVRIYIAFARIYERYNDWKMARDYYQQVIDECKKDVPGHSIIDKYEKRLQFVNNKITENE